MNPPTRAARSDPPKRTMRLEAVGQACGEFPDTTYAVTDATSRKLRGTDGWISLILATGGRANVEAIDT